MTNRFWQFPQDGRKCTFRGYNGYVGEYVPGTHPTGRPGYYLDVPVEVTGGGELIIERSGKDTFSTGAVLLKLDDGTGYLGVDDVRLNDSFKPASRNYTGNMCGIRVAGLPPIPGGASNPELFLSWFVDRYSMFWEMSAIDAYIGKGNKDILLSWPDSRSIGVTAEGFRNLIQSLQRRGLTVTVMLLSKYYDPWYDVEGNKQKIREILPYLVKTAPKICLGWELSLWLSPWNVQDLVDWLSPQVVSWGGLFYVHFQQGYSHYAYPGEEPGFAIYWNRNVGKLTGIYHQRDLSWGEEEYPARIKDCLDRFAGATGCSPDSGFNHPFDFIALEITAQPQYDGSMSEAEGNRWGRIALNTPPSYGPLGIVPVMGSGNGQ